MIVLGLDGIVLTACSSSRSPLTSGSKPVSAQAEATSLCEQYALPIAQAAGATTLSQSFMSDESDVAAWNAQSGIVQGTVANGAESEFSGMSASTPLAVCFFPGTFTSMAPPVPGQTSVPATVTGTYIAVVETGGIVRGGGIRPGIVSPPPTIATS